MLYIKNTSTQFELSGSCVIWMSFVLTRKNSKKSFQLSDYDVSRGRLSPALKIFFILLLCVVFLIHFTIRKIISLWKVNLSFFFHFGHMNIQGKFSVIKRFGRGRNDDDDHRAWNLHHMQKPHIANQLLVCLCVDDNFRLQIIRLLSSCSRQTSTKHSRETEKVGKFQRSFCLLLSFIQTFSARNLVLG